MFTPRIGVRDPAMSRATRSIVPSPPKTRSRSTRRASAAVSALMVPLIPAHCAVTGSVWSFLPAALIKRAASLTTPAQDTFSELPTTPTRLILSPKFFKECQELSIARRSNYRGRGSADPAQFCQGVNKLSQITQYSPVNFRVPNHARAFIGLRFTRLELRLN